MPYDPHASRLTWNAAEKIKFLNRAVQLRRENPTLSQHEALWAAQDVILVNRRKTRFTHYFEQALLRGLNELEEQVRLNPELQMAVAPEPTQEKASDVPEQEIAMPEPAPEPVMAEEPEPQPQPVSPLMQMCRDLGAALGAALAQELGPMFIDAMKQAFNAQIDTRIPEAMIDFEKYEGKALRPRVAVVGLLGPQRRTIEEAFPHVDIRWLDNGAPGNTVRTVAGTCEEVYLMTKFIRHHTQNAVAREKRVMVNGGVSDLVRVMGARYARHLETQAHAH